MLLKIISLLVMLAAGNNALNSGVEYAVISNLEATETISGAPTSRVSNFDLSFDFEIYFNLYDPESSIEDLLVYEDKVNISNSINIYNDTIKYNEVLIMFTPGVNSVKSYNSEIEFNFNISITILVYYSTRLSESNLFQKSVEIEDSFYLEQNDSVYDLTYDISYTTEYRFDLTNTEYQEGYNEGYDDGYIEGVNDGENDGYNRGKEEGYNEGFNEGYNEGYNEGLINGDTEDSIFTFLNGVFRAVDAFLSVEIVPGITLWAVVLIPIVFGVLAFFLNLWR